MRTNDSPWSVLGAVAGAALKKKNLVPLTTYYFRIEPISSDTDDLVDGWVGSVSSNNGITTEDTLSPFLKRTFAGTNELLTKVGKVPLSSAVSSHKLLLLYVSAHWCGPCRQFTPMLSSFYEENGGGTSKGNFEIVFLSADHDEGAMLSYFRGEMPWLAVPYDDDCRERIQGELRIQGIPSLKVFCSSTGRLIEDNVRELNSAKLSSWLSQTSGQASAPASAPAPTPCCGSATTGCGGC